MIKYINVWCDGTCEVSKEKLIGAKVLFKAKTNRTVNRYLVRYGRLAHGEKKQYILGAVHDYYNAGRQDLGRQAFECYKKLIWARMQPTKINPTNDSWRASCKVQAVYDEAINALRYHNQNSSDLAFAAVRKLTM